jgi:4-hydroxybenzoate polyprenyltransferase
VEITGKRRYRCLTADRITFYLYDFSQNYFSARTHYIFLFLLLLLLLFFFFFSFFFFIINKYIDFHSN